MPFFHAARAALLIVLAVVTTFSLAVAQADPAQAEALKKAMQVLNGLHWQKTGSIQVPSAEATITLNPDFYYLNSSDAQDFVEKIWGNPRDSSLLGMIFPANVEPLSEDAWGVLITYEDSGHVSDSDAATINYGDLLTQMKQEAHEESEDRIKQGYSKMELMGWAAQPHYDKEAHKLYWAMNYDTGDPANPGLNYRLRILGRQGVLVLNAIGGANQFKMIDSKTAEVLSMADFNPGNKYTDYNASTDKLAEGGLAALIGGGALYGAVKLGLFAGLLKVLLVGWKFVLIGVLAVGAAVKNFFSNLFGQKTVKLPNDQNRQP